METILYNVKNAEINIDYSLKYRSPKNFILIICNYLSRSIDKTVFYYRIMKNIMPRPKTKQQLIEQSEGSFQELMAYLETLSDEIISAEFKLGTLNRNVRDVMAHLHHWHLMLISWYEEGMNGTQPKMPAVGYTWRTVPLLNQEINRKYKEYSYKRVITAFKRSHENLSSIIVRHNNDELFTKKKFKWTGSTSLAAYLISNTSSHYDWAIKLIKRSLKPVTL